MATVFALKDLNPGIWFKFNEDDPESGEICVRPLNAQQMDAMRKKGIKKKVEYKHGQRFEVQETNDEVFQEMLWDYVIHDWKGLEDDDGTPIPCTTENKLRLVLEHAGFATGVGEFREKAAEIIEDQIKVAEKNSLSGSSGLKKSQAAKSAKA